MSKPEKPAKPTKPVFLSPSDNLTLDRLIVAHKADKRSWRLIANPGVGAMPTIEQFDQAQGVAPAQFYFNRKESAESAAAFLGITDTA